MRTITFNSPISQLEIGNESETIRVSSILKNKGIKTVGQLCKLVKKDLQKIDDIGDITIIRLEVALDKYGLSFGMTNDELTEFKEARDICHKDDVMKIIKGNIDQMKNNHEGKDDDTNDVPEEDDEKDPFGEDFYDEEEYQEKELSNLVKSFCPKLRSTQTQERLWDVAKDEFLHHTSPELAVEDRARCAVYTALKFIVYFELSTDHKSN